MRIAHLSDLHICQKSRPKNLEKTRRLIDYALQQNTDHFVFSGDIVHLARPEDFIAFRHVLEEFQLLDSSRATLVIGNHDIFGGVYFAEDVLTFPQQCEAVDYHKRLIEFKNYFFETFENTYFPASHEPYPFAKKVGDVVFIGLNSIHPYSKWKNLFASKGMVDKNQLDHLRQIFQKGEFQNKTKIAIVHHHFRKVSYRCSLFKNTLLRNLETYGNKLKNRNQVARLLAKYHVDLVLHGHEHDSHEYFYKGVRFLNSGGAIEKNGNGQLRINFVTVRPNEILTETQAIAGLPQKEHLFIPELMPIMA
ncbi:MAG: metallophosphoesterase [candidate division KSB1 bacterium]|nr:metallophosphoesterase [candidate division KSB1 bacterium]MDZ7357756.1 metallophosphoesterase [candidate division KSB1 bacterium]